MRRTISSKLEETLDRWELNNNVLLIQGARQVGKTYLVESIIEKKDKTISVNLEKQPQIKMQIDEAKDFSEFTLILQSQFGFKNNDRNIVFIDEAQESHKLGSFVRQMKEDWEFTKVILSGSSMSKMFSEKTRIPVGRIEYLNVLPFSFREFLRCGSREELLEHALTFTKQLPKVLYDQLLELYDNYLLVGGMPEVVLAYYAKQDYRKVLAYLVASQRDDFYRKEKLKQHLFIDALQGVANHVGSTSKYSHMSSNTYDAKIVMELLECWFLVYKVQQKGSLPTQSFYPKRYMYDLGILRHLRENAIPRISTIHTLNEALRTPLGGLIENAVLLSLLEGAGGYDPISSWKKNNREPVEVDFIKKTESETIPMEVKATLNASNRHCNNLITYLTRHSLQSGVLVTMDNLKIFNIKDKVIKNIPAFLIS